MCLAAYCISNCFRWSFTRFGWKRATPMGKNGLKWAILILILWLQHLTYFGLVIKPDWQTFCQEPHMSSSLLNIPHIDLLAQDVHDLRFYSLRITLWKIVICWGLKHKRGLSFVTHTHVSQILTPFAWCDTVSWVYTVLPGWGAGTCLFSLSIWDW